EAAQNLDRLASRSDAVAVGEAGRLPTAPARSALPETTGTVKKVRDPDQPSQDRQGENGAPITPARDPLQPPRHNDARKLKAEGKLGHHLAWMVKNNILQSTNRGYWPFGLPVPK